MPFIAIPRDDVDPPMPTLSGLPENIPFDTRKIPEMAMVALKIYAFGGLALMVCTVVAAFSYWVWIVVINQEWADSPPWLDLNPERMRAQELGRIARHKARKEERQKEKERREQEKFSPPPLRLFKRKNRDRSSTLPVVGFADPPLARKGVHTPPSSVARPRKSSLSTPASKGKKGRRVSWASSTTTLDVNGNTSQKPIETTHTHNHPMVHRPTNLLHIPAFEDALRRMPRARAASPRVSVSIDARARQGPDMAAVTTPDMARSWANPSPDTVMERRCY